MIHDYKNPDENYATVVSVVGMVLLLCSMLLWTGYHWGYGSAKEDYSRPTKFRCHEDVVYEDYGGYWRNTKQPCKKLEDIK